MGFSLIKYSAVDLDISGTRHNLEQLKITRGKRQSRVDYLDKEFRRIDKLFRRGSTILKMLFHTWKAVCLRPSGRLTAGR
jgi:hypothetical protein